MKLLLPDVNVLVALLYPIHPNNAQAHLFLETLSDATWASCPLTTNGTIRVLASLEKSLPLEVIVSAQLKLQSHLRATKLEFQPELTDESLFDYTHLRGHNQLTDAQLLAIAVHHDAQLLTFDRNIPWRAVKNATLQHIHLLSA